MNHLKIAKGQSGEISPNLVILPKSTRYLELTWVGKVHSRTPEIQKISVHCSMENEHYSFYLRDLTALNGSCLQFQQRTILYSLYTLI